MAITRWTMNGVVCAALLAGCASRTDLPSELEQQVDRSATFSQLKQSPDSYRGRLVMLGGEVLNAKRLKDGTRIEILQLPLDEDGIPVSDRTASEGRFFAIKREFLDPATLPHGTRVTIVGEVTGAVTLPLDETEYTYLTLELKNLKVWPKMEAYARPYRLYPYRPYPYGSPYWWRPWGYSPYWW